VAVARWQYQLKYTASGSGWVAVARWQYQLSKTASGSGSVAVKINTLTCRGCRHCQHCHGQAPYTNKIQQNLRNVRNVRNLNEFKRILGVFKIRKYKVSISYTYINIFFSIHEKWRKKKKKIKNLQKKIKI
jgi:hypothetical protein